MVAGKIKVQQLLHIFAVMLPLFAFLASCDLPFPNQAALSQAGTGSAYGAPCNACHAYPPEDLNHAMHLEMLDEGAVPIFKDKITCYDCHGHSIQADTQMVIDTFFYGQWGDRVSGREYPDDSLLRQGGVALIDTIWEHIPVFSPGADTLVSQPDLQTGREHLNGRVDVYIHSRNSGWTAVYDRERLTCTAVACHGDIESPYPVLLPGSESKDTMATDSFLQYEANADLFLSK